MRTTADGVGVEMFFSSLEIGGLARSSNIPLRSNPRALRRRCDVNIIERMLL